MPRLQQLSADRLDRFYADMLAGGRRGGGGLSPKTVRYLHTTLHKALGDAVRKNLIVRNPAEAADPPKLRQAGSRDLRTWSPEELRMFLLGVADHPLSAAWVLAATTGMRRGEILGLRWADIDFGSRRLAVRQTLLSVGYKLTFGTPKTARGRRTIALDTTTLEALARHRGRQVEESRRLGLDVTELGLVFTKVDGTPIHPDIFTQTFERLVARLGLPRIRLHDLRHTHATLGLASGVPAKVMSDRLGHSTVAFTQDVYMHAIPRIEEAAAQQLADLIFNETSGAD
jgi:integrase